MSEISTYHDQLKDTLQTAFPVLRTVASFRVGETLETPAILIDIESLRLGQLTGEGRTPIVLSVSLHCVLGHTTPDLELEVRNFAAQVINLIRDQYFGIGDDVRTPENLSAQLGEFKPGKSGFETMVVTYEQVLYMGAPAFDLTGPISTELTFNVHDDDTVVR